MIHIRKRIYTRNKNELSLLDKEPIVENQYQKIEESLFLKSIKSYLKKDSFRGIKYFRCKTK